ncbi:MAG TPA: transglycosylase SLT domain-containing protein [Rhodocyclaceae bacterium]|nr:transglycosylase SLT domain-containing protein [Rhodocyclaceae bacterium]
MSLNRSGNFIRHIVVLLLCGVASYARAQGTADVAPPALATMPPSDVITAPVPSSPLNSVSQTLREDEPTITPIDLTKPTDDLLQRLRNGFAMPDLHDSYTADRQAWFLNNPSYLKRALERSKRYLYYIVSELEARGMPTELALLPIVESAYNPLAASRAKALGMWQFIPSTGKNYRLEQNWWLDQRRDVIASTKAALDYLQYLYEMYGDWQLALASYNWGEGSVGRAIAKNQAQGLPTDYQSLTMPLETRYYVPKLQAIKNIIANPELYGLKLDAIPNRPYFVSVNNPGGMDVMLAAKLAEIPVDEFIALNPAYQRPVMTAESKSPLILPADKAQIFQDNLDHHEAQDKPLSAWKHYTLKRGEKLETVAARNDISVAYLKKLNGIGPRTKVTPGFGLLVPGPDAPRPDQIAALDAQLPDPPSEKSASSDSVCHKDKHGKKICHKVVARSSGKHGKKTATQTAAKTPGKKMAPKVVAKATTTSRKKH